VDSLWGSHEITGGTNKPLIPPQSTVNASMPIDLTFQYLE
jgi:hypothetical protein